MAAAAARQSESQSLSWQARTDLPPNFNGKYDSAISIILPALAIAFAAFCVWLGVRIFNRRERWAKRTLAALVGLPVPWAHMLDLVRPEAVVNMQFLREFVHRSRAGMDPLADVPQFVENARRNAPEIATAECEWSVKPKRCQEHS